MDQTLLQKKHSQLSNRVILSLGSNEGDSVALLCVAREKLSERHTIVDASLVHHTKAWGKTDQPDFLNQVIALVTDVSPHALLDEIHEIEASLGRVRAEKWGPRPIDIDIILFGDLTVDDPDLQIPHPLYKERPFVYELMKEIGYWE